MDPGKDHYLKRELYELIQKDGRIFDFLQEGALDGLWYWDVERPAEEWLSPRFKEVLGYEDHEVPNSSEWWQAHIFAEDLPVALENFRKHFADPRHPYDQVVRYRHKTGSTVWIRCRGIAIRDGSGRPVRMLGVHTDVTAVIDAERLRLKDSASREAAGRFRLIAESLPQLIWICDTEGRADFLSRQWIDYTGMSEEMQIGPGWLQSIHPDDRVAFVRVMESKLPPGDSIRTEFRIRRRDGVYRWFDTRATPLRGAECRVLKWIGSSADIEKQRETHAAMRASDERLKAIISHMQEGLIVADTSGELLYLNNAALQMHGFGEGAEPHRRRSEFEEIFELQTLDGVLLPPDQWPLARLVRGERLRDFEVRVRRRDLEWERIFSYGGTRVLEDAGGPLAFLTVGDITERKESEALLRGQKKVLEMVTLGEPLPRTLEVLLRFAESQSVDMLCSVLLLESDGRRVRHGAAPSLPAEYCRAIDGAPIGPCAGSCGTAAYRKEPVFVADIASDLLWADYRHLALAHGLKACWSTPIFDQQRHVIGTFAIYHRRVGLPTERHRRLIDFATHTAAICISRHRTEAALLESETRYARAVRGTHDGLWDWDIVTDEDYLSPRWKELLGFTDEELPNVSGTFFSRIHPDDVPRVQAAVADHLQQRKPYDIEVRLRTKSGDYRWYRCRGQAEWSDEGRPLRMAGSISDVTERVKAQKALRDTVEFKRQIIAGANDGIAVLDRHLRYIIWNPFMEHLMGLRADEVLGRSVEQLFPWVRKGGALAAMRQALAGETISLPDSVRIRAKDGRSCWVHARLAPLRNAAGGIIGVIVAVIDITERTVAEQSLRRSHEQLRALAARLQLVREEQSAHIAREIHDVLGQQLTALKLDLAWLRRRVTGVAEVEIREALAKKLHSTTDLVDTTIHTVQKIATELRPGLLDKLGLAAALDHEVREFAERAGLGCTRDIAAEPLDLDPKRSIEVFRIAQELMTNIARHAQATAFSVRLARAPHGLTLEVRDNGRGITAKEIEDADALGLLGMKERAQLIGGCLDLSGEPGKGTTAILTLHKQPVS